MKIILSVMFFILLSFPALAQKESRHFCRAIQYDSCRLEYALVCMDGYIDGCLTQQTTLHQCVVKDDGPSCQLDIAILCPAGFRDGCEVGRTQTHVCIPAPGLVCQRDPGFECPEHFEDVCD